jgi:hypothetical protein
LRRRIPKADMTSGIESKAGCAGACDEWPFVPLMPFKEPLRPFVVSLDIFAVSGSRRRG